MSKFPCAGIIVFHNDQTIIVSTERGNHSFPKGKMNVDESDIQAAWRELNEETGLTSTQVELIEGVSFDEMSDKGNPSIRYFVGRLRPSTSRRQFAFDSTELAKVEWVDVDVARHLPKLKTVRQQILGQAYSAYLAN